MKWTVKLNDRISEVEGIGVAVTQSGALIVIRDLTIKENGVEYVEAELVVAAGYWVSAERQKEVEQR